MFIQDLHHYNIVLDIYPKLVINGIMSFFTHNWDGTPVTSADFNAIQYTNANGELLSIERLRYVVSDIILTTSSNENLVLDVYPKLVINGIISFFTHTIIGISFSTYVET